LKSANDKLQLLQQQMRRLQRPGRAELADQRVLELQEEEGKLNATARQAKAKRNADQTLIAKLQTGLQHEQARLSEMEAVSKAQLNLLHFQLTVNQLLQAQPNPQGALCLRSPCSAAPLHSWLHAFGEYVERVFVETRASHRRNNQSSDMCESPEYEILGVDAVTNPDLADRQRQFIQQAESREPRGSRQYSAHRVVSSLPESMKLRRLLAGIECFDEGMLLGWHGASDKATRDIVSDGFNPYCAGSGSGSLFGKGLYTAENSSKADQYAGPASSRFKKHTGSMCMILAAVYCGNMYEAKLPTAATREWTKPPSPTPAETKATGIKR
jgi:hypothetical protein